jgi:hypothetical protein
MYVFCFQSWMSLFSLQMNSLLSGVVDTTPPTLVTNPPTTTIQPTTEVPIQPITPKSCPVNDPNYAYFGGTCYFFDTNERNKERALSNCLSQNGKLWEPKSLARINQVHKKAMTVEKTQWWWVGISDDNIEGKFQYDSNDEDFPFEHKKAPWNQNEPNGAITENCVIMHSNDPGTFIDVKCSDTRYSICEFPSDSTGKIKLVIMLGKGKKYFKLRYVQKKCFYISTSFKVPELTNNQIIPQILYL